MPEWGWLILVALAFLVFILGSRRRRAPVVPVDDPDDIWLDTFFSRTCRFDKLDQTIVAYRQSRNRPELVTIALPEAVVFASANGQTTFRELLERVVEASASGDVAAHKLELYAMMRHLVSEDLIRLHAEPDELPPELQRPVSPPN